MESIEQPFDSIAHIGDLSSTTVDDKAGLIETNNRSKRFFNGDSPRAESSPLHQNKSTNSILRGPQNQGLRIIIISSVVFAVAVTVALILTIYLEPKQVHGHAAVSCDDIRCSEAGLKILQQGGNAVDAAVTAAFCLGVVNPAHSGIGGGGFVLVHDHKMKKSVGYNFRETTPKFAQQNSFVGVPGFVKGLAEMQEVHGKLLWKDLLQPAIDLAKGFKVSEELARILSQMDKQFFRKNFPGTSIFLNQGGDVKDVNDTVQWPELASTLEKIQKDRDSLYSDESDGGLLTLFMKDIADKVNITLEDMRNYTVQKPEILKSKFKELTVASLPPPAGGSLVALMLNMIDKLNWKDDKQKDSMTYHQLIEVFKFAFAQKGRLDDPAFNLSMENVTAQIISPEFAAELVQRINDNKTLDDPKEYGPGFSPSKGSGMSHISVIDSSELMVSATLGLNSNFGSQVFLEKTGIWLNKALMDFNDFHTDAVPGKRPLSSMSPVVLYNDEHPCAHRLIIGGSNGEKILTGIVEVVVNSVIFKMNLDDAIAAPRIHDQLDPDQTLVEDGVPEQVIKDLIEKGHNITSWKVLESSSVVVGIEKTNDDIRAYSDSRKFGQAANY